MRTWVFPDNYHWFYTVVLKNVDSDIVEISQMKMEPRKVTIIPVICPEMMWCTCIAWNSIPRQCSLRNVSSGRAGRPGVPAPLLHLLREVPHRAWTRDKAGGMSLDSTNRRASEGGRRNENGVLGGEEQRNPSLELNLRFKLWKHINFHK